MSFFFFSICSFSAGVPRDKGPVNKSKNIAGIMMTSSNGNIFRVTGLSCGNSPVTDEFLAQRPVTRSFDVFFDLRLNICLSKQSRGWWSETLSRSLWRHSNDNQHIHWPTGLGNYTFLVAFIDCIDFIACYMCREIKSLLPCVNSFAPERFGWNLR